MDFGKGIALGVALSMTLAIALLAYEFRGMAGVYADFGSPQLPLLTRATIAGAWLVGMPVAGAAGCIALFVIRPRSLMPYVALAVVLTVVAVLTWYGPRLPIFELAGNIKAD
jgi:hypothetical protein